MTQYLSPGVYVDEIDLSNYIPAVSTSVGAYVGEFEWGPLFEVVHVTRADRLDNLFGEPSNTNYEGWFTAWNFLNYAARMKIVRVCDRATTACATASGAGVLILNREDWAENWEDGSGGGAYGAWAARHPGTKGNFLYVSLCGTGNAYNGAMALTANSTTSNAVLIFASNVQTDAARPMQVGDQIRIGAQNNWMEVITISSDGLSVTVNNANLVVNTQTGLGVSARWEFADRFPYMPTTTEPVAKYNGSNDEIHIAVVGKFDRFSHGRKGYYYARRRETLIEKFVGLSVAGHNRLQRRSNYYVDVIKKQSRFIYWMGHPEGGTNWGNTGNDTAFTVLTKPYSVLLSGGTYGAPGTGDIIEGYRLLQDPKQEDVSFFLTGSHNSTVKSTVIEIAEQRADAVAFLGPSKASVVLRARPEIAMQAVIDDRNQYKSTSYGFYVDNWKYQYDPFNDKYRWVPIDGDVAGLAARTDDDYDAWWSFAGLNRGQIQQCKKLAWQSDEGMRDEMYPLGINSIVSFPGEGKVLWGDRTMQLKPSAFDRINVRRLFIVLEKAISRAAKYLLFEFNDAFTRAQFVAMIDPYLREIKGKRGIYDYRIVCDETNNTGEVIDRNEFVGDIYIKPAKSINFLQLNFVAVRTDAVFEEIDASF